jgi:hypothetical protein
MPEKETRMMDLEINWSATVPAAGDRYGCTVEELKRGYQAPDVKVPPVVQPVAKDINN